MQRKCVCFGCVCVWILCYVKNSVSWHWGAGREERGRKTCLQETEEKHGNFQARWVKFQAASVWELSLHTGNVNPYLSCRKNKVVQHSAFNSEDGENFLAFQVRFLCWQAWGLVPKSCSLCVHAELHKLWEDWKCSKTRMIVFRALKHQVTFLYCFSW